MLAKLGNIIVYFRREVSYVKRFRIILDVMMMILSLVLMGGNQLFPADIVHEICGAATFALWIIHIILNRRWYASFFKNLVPVSGTKLNALRIMQIIINIGIVICAVFLMVSGIIISNHVFVFLHIEHGASFARTSHLIASHWYFVFMSLHIGMHVGVMVRMVHEQQPALTKVRIIILRTLVTVLCLYGVYAFIVRGIWKYLLYRQPFFFFDLSRGYVLFFADYACMMILIAALSYMIAKAAARK